MVCRGHAWDEAENELALWSVVLRGGPPAAAPRWRWRRRRAARPQRLCGAAHGGGDVLGLCAAAPRGRRRHLRLLGLERRRRALPRRAVGGERGGAPPARTAASSGCLRRELGRRRAGARGGGRRGRTARARRERRDARDAAGARGGAPRRVLGAAEGVFTVGSRLLQWDVRTRAPPVALAAEPNKGPHEAPQLQCVASHPQKPQIVAAGSSEGAVYVWDVRAAAPLATVRAPPPTCGRCSCASRRTAASSRAPPTAPSSSRPSTAPPTARGRRRSSSRTSPSTRSTSRPAARRRLRRRGAHFRGHSADLESCNLYSSRYCSWSVNSTHSLRPGFAMPEPSPCPRPRPPLSR